MGFVDLRIFKLYYLYYHRTNILPDGLIIPEVPDLPKDEIVNGLCLPARGGLNKEGKNFQSFMMTLCLLPSEG